MLYNSSRESEDPSQRQYLQRHQARKSDYLAKAAEYYSRAKQLIEVDQDWQASGSMILKALAEERKSENTGLQVMNVIKYQKPKTKLEFNFRS